VTRPALLRAAVAPLVAAPLVASSLLATSLLLAPAAQAAPPHAYPALAYPALTATPGGDDIEAAAGDPDPDRPVRIEVGRFEPRTVTPGSTVTVAGTLTNTGDQAIDDLSLRLQRGEVRTTREELAAAVADADPATSALTAFRPVPGTLAPGATLEFSYSVPAAELQLGRDGVYPVLLNLNGTAGEEERRRVGELATFVVQQPAVTPARTTVAWLWPITERTHRDAAGDFVDDALTEAIGPGGRLDRALTVIERLPSTPQPGKTDPVPAVPVTLAVDPALVEELTVMADGPYAVAGDEAAGRGTEAAQAFLERLRTVAAVHSVAALPYGDVDADALVTAGLTDTLVRTLPGSPAGTAHDPPEADGAASPTTPAESTGTAGPVAPVPRTGDSAGVEILSEALDVDPREDLAWAAGGSLRADTLATLQASGVSQVVLGTGSLTEGDQAVGFPAGRAAARTTVTTDAGPLGVLIADPTLGDIAGSAERTPGGPRLAEQRYLAELAVLSLQAPRGVEQTVLVAPPRQVEAGPEGAGAMMADTAGLPWLRPASVEGLTGAPSADAGRLAEPVDAVQLDATGLAVLREGVAARDDLAGAVVGDADTALATTDAGAARASSVAWRADAEGFRSLAEDFRTRVDRLRGRVTLLAPADGTYTLASSDSPLVLTVTNDLPFAVQVRLDVRTRGNRGLSIADIGIQTLAPEERTTLQVPTEVRQSGGFGVTASLLTPSGGTLGDPVQMNVKSTAYGPISLIITIGSAALLGLLFLRRLVRFVLRRRAAAAGSTAGDAGPGLPGPEGALAARPPTRSPV
jgi:hypothetical protein